MKRLFAFAIVLSALGLAAPLLAAPETSSGSRDRDPPATRDQAQAEGGQEPIESISQSGAADEDIDRLERAIDEMRSAKQRIDAEDTGRETQKVQKQALGDLEELLKLLRKRQQCKNPQQNAGQNQDESPSQRQKADKDQGDPQNSGKNSSGNPNDPSRGRRNPDKSRDSQARSDPDRLAAEEQARRNQMIKDVWGHLPPHLRAAMQNAFSEKYLPKYEDLVKKYYEALAEKNRTKKK